MPGMWGQLDAGTSTTAESFVAAMQGPCIYAKAMAKLYSEGIVPYGDTTAGFPERAADMDFGCIPGRMPVVVIRAGKHALLSCHGDSGGNIVAGPGDQRRAFIQPNRNNTLTCSSQGCRPSKRRKRLCPHLRRLKACTSMTSYHDEWGVRWDDLQGLLQPYAFPDGSRLRDSGAGEPVG